MRDKGSIFPTFFIAGFECSTFVWKDGKRKDYVRITGHDRHLKQDYDRVMDLGVGVVREAIRWPMVDLGDGRYDWSSVDAAIEAMEACSVTAIWDWPTSMCFWACRRVTRWRMCCLANIHSKK